MSKTVYKPTLECDTCGYTLFGDMPQIVMTCDDCIQEKEMFENMNTKQRLEEIVHWITEDLWEEISKHNTIRFNWFMLQSFVRADFHIARRVLSYMDDSGFTDKSKTVSQISEYFSCLDQNPLYKETTLVLQWESEALGAQIAVKNKLLDNGRKILPYKTNRSQINFDFNNGLLHQVSTLVDALNFACCGRWKNIVLAGVDLNTTDYFFLPKGTTTLFQSERAGEGQMHSTANHGIVPIINNFKKLMEKNNMQLYVLSEKSLLSEKLKVYEFEK